jgi:hypothetical protein
MFDAYYAGNHPVPWLPENQRDDFRHLLALTKSNYMGLVVDTPVQRMHVDGFRFGGTEDGDADAWRIWQANNLDAGSQQAFLEAFIGGVACWLVAPNPDDPETPLITVEHGSQAIVEHVPGSNRRKRAAALKVWQDDWTGLTNATLYLPDFLWKLQAKPKSGSNGNLNWEPRLVDGEAWPAPNPLGAVTMVEMPNRPRLLCGGVSELADVTVIQDRINKTIADRLMTQDFGAFPQKYVTNYEVEDDPTTGQPVQPFKLGRNRLLVAEGDSNFGQFLPAPLDPYSSAKNEDVKDIASRTQTPAQYLLGEIVNISAEALKAAESGLVSKILNRREPFADALEDVMRLAFRAIRDPKATDMAAETIWRDPEFRLEAQIVDAAVKKETGSAYLASSSTRTWATARRRSSGGATRRRRRRPLTRRRNSRSLTN